VINVINKGQLVREEIQESRQSNVLRGVPVLYCNRPHWGQTWYVNLKDSTNQSKTLLRSFYRQKDLCG